MAKSYAIAFKDKNGGLKCDSYLTWESDDVYATAAGALMDAQSMETDEGEYVAVEIAQVIVGEVVAVTMNADKTETVVLAKTQNTAPPTS